jgi:hypothetical protein
MCINSIHIKSGVVIYWCYHILCILTIINLVGKKPTDTVTSIRHQRISHSLSDGKYTVHPANRSYNSLQDLIAEETSELQLLHPYRAQNICRCLSNKMSRAIKKSRRSNQATRTIKAFNVCINPDPSATRGDRVGVGEIKKTSNSKIYFYR